MKMSEKEFSELMSKRKNWDQKLNPKPKPMKRPTGKPEVQLGFDIDLSKYSDTLTGCQKRTDREVVQAYAQTGSIWKAAELLGFCGQSVQERLKKLGVDINVRIWTDSEIAKVKALYESGFESGDGQLKKLSKEIGRTVPFISRKAKELGLSDLKRKRSEEYKEKGRRGRKEWLKNNKHPRGALGLRHSDEAKKVIGEKSKKAWYSRSDEVNAAIILKRTKSAEKNGTLHKPRDKTSWKQGWRTIGENRKYYRSRWEANYARYLEFLKSCSEIKAWEHEPETFWFEGVKRGSVSYLPDFRVTLNNGEVEYHEVKGWMDARSKTKIKRMAKYYPEVKLIVIDSKVYKGIQRQASGIICDWE